MYTIFDQKLLKFARILKLMNSGTLGGFTVRITGMKAGIALTTSDKAMTSSTLQMETSGLGQKTTIGMIQMIPRILYGGLSAVMDNLTSRVTFLNTVSFWQVVLKKWMIQGIHQHSHVGMI